jgi:excisionase family DNA binding protein
MDINERVALTPEEWAKRNGVSRAHVYRLIKRGELESFKIGRCRRIPINAIPTQQEEET